MMILETYKEPDKLPQESRLAKAYKDGNYQASLDSLLNTEKKNWLTSMFKNK